MSELIYRDVKQNDSNGNCIRIDTYYPDGTSGGYILYERDENGHEIRMSKYDGNGNLEYTNEW